MQAPGGPKEDTSGNFKFGGWTFPYFDDFAGKVMDSQMKGKYDLLLGQKTYEIFANYWPHHEENWPGVNDKTKYVVSKNLKSVTWKNSVVLTKLNDIKKLKAGKGSSLYIFGSGNLIQTLLKNDLVDELWFKIFPITLGRGKRLFDDGTIPAEFKLIDSKISPKGVIFANYERAGGVKTGSFA